MKIFPTIAFLRKIGNVDADIAAIDKNMAEAANIADAGERFLRYNKLAMEANDMTMKGAWKKVLPGFACLAGGAVMFLGGLCSLNPALAAGGAALVYSTLSVVRELGADAEDATALCRDRCVATREALIKNTPPKDFAASSQFDEIMCYRNIRNAFLLASAREKTLPPAQLQTKPAATSLHL